MSGLCMRLDLVIARLGNMVAHLRSLTMLGDKCKGETSQNETKQKSKLSQPFWRRKLDSLDDVSVLYILFPAYTSKSFKVYQQYTYSYEKWEIEIDTGPFIFDAIQFYPEIVDIPVKQIWNQNSVWMQDAIEFWCI